MSIALIVTGGYGNGTFSGTIASLTLRGYTQGVVVVDVAPPRQTLRLGPENTTLRLEPETPVYNTMDGVLELVGGGSLTLVDGEILMLVDP